MAYLCFLVDWVPAGEAPGLRNSEDRNHQEVWVSMKYTHYNSIHPDWEMGQEWLETDFSAADPRTIPCGARAGRHNVFRFSFKRRVSD